MTDYGTQRGRPPEPPQEPDNLVDDDLGPEAMADRPQAERPHGGLRDTGHADFFEIEHRYLADPTDLHQPERAQVVDDYTSQVRGAGARTQGSVGGTDPARDAGADPRADRPDAEPGAT